MIESLSLFTFAVAVISLTVVYWLMLIAFKPKNLPSGPVGCPLLGTVINHEKPHLHLTELAKKHGPVFSFYRFGTMVVVLNSYQVIRDYIIKQGDKFANRPNPDLPKREVGGNYGLIWSNGHLWKEQRRFSLNTLRDFGLGKTILEGGILEEVQIFLSAIRDQLSNPFDIQFLLNKAVSNVICRLVYGKRFDYSNEEVFYALDAWNRKIKNTNPTTIIGIKMWMIPFIPGAKKRMIEGDAEEKATREFTKKMIDEHRMEFDPANEPTDYVYAYLQKQHQLQAVENTFSDHQLMIACNQLFAAGTETTSTTLRWIILYLCVHPEIQEKVFQEIKSNIGLDCLPQFKDKNQLPYTEAVILESQRCGCLVSLTPRQCNQDVQINGYDIPANTDFMVNYWAVNMDPAIFPEPEKFIPERFLDEEGKVQRNEALMPFGAGKRICLGESLAKMELTLFFVALIQNFKFVLPKGEPQPSLEHIVGITMQPHSYKVHCIPRI